MFHIMLVHQVCSNCFALMLVFPGDIFFLNIVKTRQKHDLNEVKKLKGFFKKSATGKVLSD